MSSASDRSVIGAPAGHHKIAMNHVAPWAVLGLLCLMGNQQAQAEPAVCGGAGDPSLRAVLESLEESQRRFMRGDVSLWIEHMSRREDVAILGGWGGYEKGWEAVKTRYEWAGSRFRDSVAKLTVQYLTSCVSGDLAFTTAIERSEVKVEGQEKVAPMALRVTHVFRREHGAWKLMLRHADPLVAKIAPDAVLEKR